MFLNKPAEASTHLIDQASQSADQAVKSIQRAGDDALERVRDTSHRLQLKSERAAEQAASYVRHEPVKSILMAAVAGAAVMALVNLFTRSRGRD